MDRNSDKYGGQKESTRRKLGPHGSVVLFLEVSVGPTKLVPVLRTLLVLFNQLMSRSAEDRGQRTVLWVWVQLFFTFRNLPGGQ